MIEIFANAKIGERMRKSGITVSKGSLDYILHNVRVKDTKNSIFDKSDNIYMNDYETALEIYRTELAKRIEAYTKRTGKKLQKHTITHLSAIVNLDAHNCDTEHMRKLVEYLERKLGTKVFNWAIHKDEGWIDENGEKHVNYHAHIEMLGIDENGNSIRRKLDKKTLRELQTEVAQILNMPRGKIGSKRKWLDTYQYKEHARLKAKLAKENEELKRENERLKQELAKVKDLKELNRQSREELKRAGARREQYAELEAYIKELKEEIKAKNLTISELKERLNKKEEELLSQIAQLKEQNKELLQRNSDLEHQLQMKPKPEIREKIVYREDTTKIQQLKEELEKEREKNAELEQLLKQKDEEIERLEREEMERDWSERETATRKKKRKTRGFKM